MNAQRHPWRFVLADEGVTTIQQAILIALIVGGAFLALDGLGFVANKTFNNTSHQFTAASHNDAHAVAEHPTDTEAQAANNPPALPCSITAITIRLTLLLVACPLVAVGWYVLNRKKKVASDEEESLPPVPQSDAQIERDLVFDKRHNLLRLFNGDVGMLMTSRILVKHIMSEKVHFVSPNTPVLEIQELMQSKKIRHVLVCDKSRRLLGLVTVRRVEDAEGKFAADVMERDPPTVPSNGLLNPAITQIIKQRLYCLPVVDEGELVGVLTSTDVMLAFQCTLHALQQSAHEATAHLPAGMVPGFMVAMNSEAASDELVHA